MVDQSMDYLPDWRDLSWPQCPECGGPVTTDVGDGLVWWRCLHCGYRWLDVETEEAADD